MRNAILAGVLCAVVVLAGCQQFRKTPTPTPDPTQLAMTPTGTVPSPVAITRVPYQTPNPTAANGVAAPSGTLSILSVSGAVPGQAASVSVQATPNTSCTLAFIAPPGSAKVGSALEPRTADATGHVSWTWNVDAGTASGMGAVTVKCGDALASTSIRIG
jgi:hypothetical protein